MTNPQQTLGRRAENVVADHLRRAGYDILARNWRDGKRGELDIIARYDDQVVFVEVRARRGPLRAAVEWALSSVDERKQARLIDLAQAYLAAHDLEDVPWRITVVAVGCHGDRLAMEVIKNAVEW